MNKLVISRLSILLVVILLPIISYAGNEKFNVRLSGENFSVGKHVTVCDDKYGYMTAVAPTQWDFLPFNVIDRVTLGIDEGNTLFIQAYSSIKVTVLISKIDLYGLETYETKDIYFTYDPATGAVADELVHEFTGYHKFDVQIIGIVDGSQNPIENPGNLYLEAQIEVNRYYDLDPLSFPIGYEINTEEIDYTSDNKIDELEVRWNYLPGAEEYDLEWIHVNDFNPVTPGGSLQPADIEYDFKYNSTRITTSKNFYRIPLLYERGYILYRVRGISHHWQNVEKTYVGKWTYEQDQGVVADFVNVYYLSNTFSSPYPWGHEPDKNWQNITNFAEDGKRKDVITYMDGTFRPRQVVTKNSTDNIAIVGQSIYDFQGRKAIDVLPTPVVETTEYSPIIKYYELFNQNTNPSPSHPVETLYGPYDFDPNAASGTCNTTIGDPMSSSQSGAAHYYSDDNPLNTGANAYIPEAAGYPFSQVEYEPDNTGRIKRQGGVGIDFQLDNHETQYFYAEPDQVQLDMMFGSEVGNSSHYRKNAVIDPNGQVSVSYLNKEEQVIATSLAGSPPLTLDPLKNEYGASLYNQYVMITDDILSKVFDTDPDTYVDNNELSLDGNSLVAKQEFLVVSDNTNYQFDYSLDGSFVYEECIPKCFDCVYDLNITLTDQCGNILPGLSYSETIDYANFANQSSGDCWAEVTLSLLNPLPPLDPQLDIGTYTVQKTLTLNEQAVQDHIADYLDEIDQCTTLYDYTHFYDIALSNIDSTDCDIVDYGYTSNDGIITNCEIGYNLMLEDVTPGGQYAVYETDVNGTIISEGAGNCIFSVLNSTDNQLCNNLTSSVTCYSTSNMHWRNLDCITYTEEFDMTTMIPVMKISDDLYNEGTSYYPALIEDLINQTNFDLGYYQTVDGVYNSNIIYVRPFLIDDLEEMMGIPTFTPGNQAIHVSYDAVTDTYTPAINRDLLTLDAFNNGLYIKTGGGVYTDVENDLEVRPHMLVTTSGYDAKYTSLIRIHYDPVSGDYSPAILNTFITSYSLCSTMFGTWYSTNDGNFWNPNSATYQNEIIFILPQLLDQLEDFINLWEEEWAESLVVFHPEYPYYEACQDYNDDENYGFEIQVTHNVYDNIDAASPVLQLTESVAIKLTSDMYDYFLANINTYADAVAGRVVIGNHEYILPFVFVQVISSNNGNIYLFERDPLFNENLGPFSQGHCTGSSPEDIICETGYWNTVGNYNYYDRMEAEYDEYQSNPNQYTMWQMAAMTANCGNFYGSPVPATCTDFFYDLGSPPSDAILDARWQQLRSYYLSAKTYIQTLRNEQTTIENDAYNGCIGLDYSNQFYHPYMAYGPGATGCHVCGMSPNYLIYQNYLRRFPNLMDMLFNGLNPYEDDPQVIQDYLENQSDYDFFMATGQCPMAQKVEDLLTAYCDYLPNISVTNFISAIGTDYTFFNATPGLNIPQFTADMLGAITAIPEPYQWNVTSANNDIITINLEPVDQTGNTCTIVLEIPASSTTTMDFTDPISHFANLQYTNLSGSDYYFTVQAAFIDGLNIEVVDLEGYTCLPVGECQQNFQNVCVPNDVAEDLILLMSMMANNNNTCMNPNTSDLMVSSGCAVEISNPGSIYFSVYDANLAAYLNTGSANWYWDGTNSFVLEDGSSNTLLNILVAPVGLNPFTDVAQFVSIIPDNTSPYNSVIVTVEYDNGTFEDFTFTITDAGSNPFVMGDCNLPVFSLCDNDENQYREDLVVFLQVMLSASGGFSNNVNLDYVPEFTDLMENHIGYGASYDWSYTYYPATEEIGGTISTTTTGYNSDNDCDFSFEVINRSYNSAGTALTIMEMDDIYTLTDFTVNTANMSGNHYYTFTVKGWDYADQEYLVLEGSTCYPIEDCDFCPPDVVVTDYILNGDFETASASCTAPCDCGIDYDPGDQSTPPSYSYDCSILNAEYWDGDYAYYVNNNNINFQFCGAPNNSYSLVNLLNRGYIAIPLDDGTGTGTPYEMEANEEYTISFTAKIDMENQDNLICDLTDFGIYLHDLDQGAFTGPTNHTPQINFDFQDYSVCENVSVNYIANGTEDYLVISNFNTYIWDQSSCTSIEPYFKINLLIDNVSIIKSSEICDPVPIPYTNPEGTEPVTFEAENPCIDYLYETAESNAWYEYEQYIDSVVNDFEERYRAECISNAIETFSKTYENSEYHYTLYYYDQSGNLTRTVPPAGVNLITNPGDLDAVVNDRADDTRYVTTAHELETTYKYNTLNQVIWQKTPDGGETCFWYDVLGRLVASQNAKQRELYTNPPQGANPLYVYSYTRYDELGRIIEVGEVKFPEDAFENDLTTYTNGVLKDDIPAQDDRLQDFPNNMRPEMGYYIYKYEVIRTVYDDYDANLLDFNMEDYLFNTIYDKNLRSRVASVYYMDSPRYKWNTGETLSTFRPYPGNLPPPGYTPPPEFGEYDFNYAIHYSYDEHGNVQKMAYDIPAFEDISQDDTERPYGHRFKLLEYEYDLVSGNVNSLNYQAGEEDEFYHRYEYDADNRLTNVYTSIDSTIWDQDGEYLYYPHGPLQRIEIGERKIQALDYFYTLQGWLKGTNITKIDYTTDVGRDGDYDLAGNINKFISQDEYALALGYHDNDYDPIGGVATPLGAGGASYYTQMSPYNLYNGNITYMTRDIREFDPNSDISMLSSKYYYDQLHRIKSSETYQTTNDVFQPQTDFYTDYAYDLNGNLLALNRNNDQGVSMDQLTYHYRDDGTVKNNQLINVNDASGVVSGSDIGDQGSFVDTDPSTWNYNYDASGNLVWDKSEEIDTILWTVHGKVKEVIREPGSDKPDLEFHYDPNGNRLCKITKPKDAYGIVCPQWTNNWLWTYYIRDPQGNIISVYEHQIDTITLSGGQEYSYDFVHTFVLHEQHIYGSSRLAVRTPDLILEDPLKILILPQICRVLGLKNYELTNHLGNVNATLSDRREAIEEPGTTASCAFHTGDEPQFGTSYGLSPLYTQSTPTSMLIDYDTWNGYPPGFEYVVERGDIVNSSVMSYYESGAAMGTDFEITLADQGGATLKDHTGTPIKFVFNAQTPDQWEELSFSYMIPYNLYDYSGTALAVGTGLKLIIRFRVDPGTPQTWFDDFNFSKAGTIKGYMADVTSTSNYYPFGMLMPQRNWPGNSVPNGGYRFGFNGKEKDDEWTGSTGATYDYGFRIYDARIARFLSVDPLAPDYPWYTPYQFAGNKPVWKIDLDGLEEADPPMGKVVLYIKPIIQTEGSFSNKSISAIKGRYTSYLDNPPQKYTPNPNGRCIDILNNCLSSFFGIPREDFVDPIYKGKSDHTSLILAERVDYTAKILQEKGYVSKSKKIKSIYNEHYKEGSEIKALNENIQDAMLEMIDPTKKGQYFFIISAGSGYHTTAVVLNNNEIGNPAFYLLDTSSDGGSPFESKEDMQNYYLDLANSAEVMNNEKRYGVTTNIYLVSPGNQSQESNEGEESKEGQENQ